MRYEIFVLDLVADPAIFAPILLVVSYALRSCCCVPPYAFESVPFEPCLSYSTEYNARSVLLVTMYSAERLVCRCARIPLVIKCRCL